MSIENDSIVISDEDTQEGDFTPEELEDDSVDWKAKAEELKGIAKRRATQLKKLKDAATKASEAAKAAAAAKEADSEPNSRPAKSKTGELDDTQLDYLDLKGVNDQDEIDVIQSIVNKTGLTVRQALKDDYVVKKLEAIRAEKALKDATPSGTKRSGSGTGDSLDLAIAKYEQSGFKNLPEDFELRSKVVDAIAAKQNSNKPKWM